MSTPRFASVDGYLASLPPVQGATLGSVIACILAAFPELEAKLAWNVPQLHRRGKYVFGVSAAKGHLSLSPWSEAVVDGFRPRLEAGGYGVTKTLFRVPSDWQVDRELLEDLVRARLAELDRA